MRRALLLLCLIADPADAEPTVGVRVAAAFGHFDELTWEAPEIDLAVTFPLGTRGWISLAGGYAILDNHNLLSDGRAGRFEIASGIRRSCWRIGATLGLELAGYHSDPDLLADQPDVDLVASRGGLFPTAGFEIARQLTSAIEVGAFARAGLRRIEVFETADAQLDARLVLGGAFIQFAIR